MRVCFTSNDSYLNMNFYEPNTMYKLAELIIKSHTQKKERFNRK